MQQQARLNKRPTATDADLDEILRATHIKRSAILGQPDEVEQELEESPPILKLRETGS